MSFWLSRLAQQIYLGPCLIRLMGNICVVPWSTLHVPDSGSYLPSRKETLQVGLKSVAVLPLLLSEGENICISVPNLNLHFNIPP